MLHRPAKLIGEGRGIIRRGLTGCHRGVGRHTTRVSRHVGNRGRVTGGPGRRYRGRVTSRARGCMRPGGKPPHGPNPHLPASEGSRAFDRVAWAPVGGSARFE
jgi:hypothetical protein